MYSTCTCDVFHVFPHSTFIATFAFKKDSKCFLSTYVCMCKCACVCECVRVSVARLLLKASEPIVRTASVALIWDYMAITLLLYTNAASVHLCVCVCVYVCVCVCVCSCVCVSEREQANVCRAPRPRHCAYM